MKILYVTTFNNKLYNATGRDMIESFVKYKTEGDLLIAHEDSLDEVIAHHRKFIFHGIASNFLVCCTNFGLKL